MHSQVENKHIYEDIPIILAESPKNNPIIPERSNSSSFTDNSYIQSLYNGNYRYRW